jgi:hypothetical protein
VIETLLIIAWYGLLYCTASIFLVAGIAVTISRFRQRRYEEEQRQFRDDLAAAFKEEAIEDGRLLVLYESPIIGDKNHPLYCHGARRGPEPPTHSLPRRFR